MPPSKREPPLRAGDKVSVACRYFGEGYTRGRAAAEPRRVLWNSDTLRDTGTVLEKASDGQVLVDFKDDEEHIWWKRKLIQFESRPQSALAVRCVRTEEDSEPDSEVEEESSDDEGEEGEGDEIAAAEDVDEECDNDNDEEEDADGWIREDDCGVDERRKTGYYIDNDPIWI